MTTTAGPGGGIVIEIGILGPLTVRRNGQILHVPRRPARMLTELVAEQGKPVSAQTLRDRLSHASGTLVSPENTRRIVADLRALIGGTPPPIATKRDENGTGYLLEPGSVMLDFAWFQAHAQAAVQALRDGDAETAARECQIALSLWRGRPFSGTASEASAPHWAGRLVAVHRNVLAVHAQALLRQGLFPDAVPELESATHLYPADGRLWRLLALACWLAERDPEAAQTIRDAYGAFGGEGIDPPSALRGLHKAILRGQLPRDGPAALGAAGF